MQHQYDKYLKTGIKYTKQRKKDIFQKDTEYSWKQRYRGSLSVIVEIHQLKILKQKVICCLRFVQPPNSDSLRKILYNIS